MPLYIYLKNKTPTRNLECMCVHLIKPMKFKKNTHFAIDQNSKVPRVEF